MRATKQVDIWIQFRLNVTDGKSKSVVLSGDKHEGYKITGKKTTNHKHVHEVESWGGGVVK